MYHGRVVDWWEETTNKIKLILSQQYGPNCFYLDVGKPLTNTAMATWGGGGGGGGAYKIDVVEVMLGHVHISFSNLSTSLLYIHLCVVAYKRQCPKVL